VNHEKIEKNVGLLAILIAVAISFGGIVEIVPLIAKKAADPTPATHMRNALEVAGRDVYVREGCYNCHSQMIRSLPEEVLRYGAPSTEADSKHDHPFQWGSKRTGPDLARVGKRYSDEWHRIHLERPQDVVPESNMPAYAFLAQKALDGDEVAAMMRALSRVGVPYTDEQIAAAPEAVKGKTQMDAVIAYLQGLGTVDAPQAGAVTGGAK
jgi:cytochrome c oxidase cbb3-type subunit 2